MCELCNTDINSRGTLIGDENEEMKFTVRNTLEVAVDWEHGLRYGEFDVKFCPMCGKEIENV